MTRSSKQRASSSKPPRWAASRAIPITSRRSRTACRRQVASGSESTGWRWFSPAATTSAMWCCFRPCAGVIRRSALRTRRGRGEQPADHAVQRASVVVGEGEVLVHRLRIGVEPPLLRGGSVDASIVLREWLLGAVIAVNLGARGDEHALAEAVAVLE